MTSPIFTLGFSLGMGAFSYNTRVSYESPPACARRISFCVPELNMVAGAKSRERVIGLHGDGSGLKTDSRFLPGAFVGVQGFVGALEEFLERFARSVIRPAAGELAPDFLRIVFDLEAVEAAQDVADFLGATF